MSEFHVIINGLGFVGGIVSVTALSYALLPGETLSVLRGLGELFGIRKEES